MKKKMNWGYGIVVTFILFAIGTFVMVYIAMTTKVDLVTEDYYEKELKYQQQIDIMSKTSALEKKVEITFDSAALTVNYPNLGAYNNYSGTVHFFRPSDGGEDFLFPVTVDSMYRQQISTSHLLQGYWRMKITWKIDQQQYYFEQPIIIH